MTRELRRLLKIASKYKWHTAAAYTHGDPLKNLHFQAITQPPKKHTTTTEEVLTFWINQCSACCVIRGSRHTIILVSQTQELTWEPSDLPALCSSGTCSWSALSSAYISTPKQTVSLNANMAISWSRDLEGLHLEWPAGHLYDNWCGRPKSVLKISYLHHFWYGCTHSPSGVSAQAQFHTFHIDAWPRGLWRLGSRPTSWVQLLLFQSPSSSAASENAATPFCCEAPETFCWLRNFTWLSISIWLTR